MSRYRLIENYEEEYDDHPSECVINAAAGMFEEIVACVDRARRSRGKTTAEEVTAQVAARLRSQNLTTEQLAGLQELMVVVARCASILAIATASQLADKKAQS
ncbi:MAG: hypothetical protein ACJ78Q_12165 [Chloroflexia bacterium]